MRCSLRWLLFDLHGSTALDRYLRAQLGTTTKPDVAQLFPSPGLKATLSPSDGERDGVRGLPDLTRYGGSAKLRLVSPFGH